MNAREYASELARHEGKRKSSLNAAQAAEVLKIIRDDIKRALSASNRQIAIDLIKAVTGYTPKGLIDRL